MADTVAKAAAAKEEGNAAFASGNYEKAIEAFTKALEVEPENEVHYSNRSAAYTKLKRFAEALADGEKCTTLKPDWGKGYSRQGSAHFLSGDFSKAVAVYALGLTKDPTSAVLLKGLGAAQKALTSPSSGKKKKKKGKKGKKKKDEEKGELPDDLDAISPTNAGGNDSDDEDKKESKEEDVEPEDHVIGIDLGTTYSCVGVWKDDQVHIIETPDGERTIPSYVAFEENDLRRLTGAAAKNQATRNTKNTIYDIKRVIGQRFSDTGVEADIRKFPFKVVAGADDKIEVVVEDKIGQKKTFAPEQISAMVLSTCKEMAEKFLGTEVKKAVITVPAYFNDSQRNATKAAGIISGLHVLRVINEPTAAALSYGLDNLTENANKEACKILIFDLGGGTFDVSILNIEQGVFTVVATGGDTRLGGEDFDNTTVDFLVSELTKQKPPGHVREHPRAMQRLRKAAESAKRQLSNSSSTVVSLDALFPNWDFKCKLTRQKFESLNKAHFTLCLDVVKRVMKDAKMKTGDIDEIVLVGGSTRIPKLQQQLQDMFDGKQLCKSLNPDEAVAYGAAVQGAILNGKRNSKTRDLLLMDVTPLSLGIETTGRVMSVIIPRNTPIPCVKTQVYTTEANYQTKVDVAVYEGERLKSDENNLLGEFTISGIESAKRGEPQVDVSFSIDSDGILDVTAVDRKTAAQSHIQIANRSRASDADIEKMIADAAKYKLEDAERIRRMEAKNQLEQTIIDCLEAADNTEDGKLANILQAAAEKEQQWIDDGEAETAKTSEIAMRRRTLARRIGNRNQQ